MALKKLTGAAKRNLERSGGVEQPWRCAQCGTAVVPGARTPCKCPGWDRKSLKEEQQ